MANKYTYETTMDKLIPQIFDEMRSNFDPNGSISNKQNKITTSAITTQSLMNEMENLDKIIDMIDNVNDVLNKSIPKDIVKMYEVCHSTNTILDSWISMQSQAGYVYRLMSEPTYIKHLSGSKNDNIGFEDEVKLENEEIEKLKREIEAERQKLSNPQSSNTQKPNLTKKTTRVRPSGIPTVSSKIAKPTISSQRKMFRR